jgi:hypothetical protein
MQQPRNVLLLRPRTKASPTAGICEVHGCSDAHRSTHRGRSLCEVHEEVVLAGEFAATIGAGRDWFFGCGCGPTLPCDSCERLAASGVRVLLVGERSTRDVEWRSGAPGTEMNLSFLMRLGAFTYGPGRERMLDVGIRWDRAINLMTPAPSGAWDARRARAVALAIRPVVLAKFELVVLLGARVAEAFGVPRLPNVRTEQFLMVSHPSGRNRQWNDLSHGSHTREAFDRAVDVVSGRAAVEVPPPPESPIPYSLVRR